MTRGEQIAANLDTVRESIAAAAGRSGRDPASITLVAVSKTKPAADIAAALQAGQVHFGENYAQELQSKHEELGEGPQFHFIGHLQRNKAKLVVGRTALIETVDSLRLAEAIDRRAAAASLSVPVLLEVNVGGEWSKSGLAAEGAAELLAQVRELPHLEPRGLMCIPPFVEPDEARPYFEQLRTLGEALARDSGLGADFGELSMGMSHDFEAAIEEGATIVRVGTAIFGARG
jgi:pyridoxal phosphate enzyme (YggS family)